MGRTWLTFLVVGGLLIGSPPGLSAQSESEADAGGEDFFPSHGWLLTGYGAADYRATFADDGTPSDFKALLAPVFLFQISDDFLFEGEVEFALEEGVTRTSLEYGQIDYTLTNNVKVVAGKFLLPFNIFTERLHPTWINSFVSPPPLYGHHGGAGPADPMLPILSDVGVQVRGTFNVGRFGYLTASSFVTQGPRAESDAEPDAGEHARLPSPSAGTALPQTEGDHGGHVEVAEVSFGDNFDDNNEDKMIGGRLGFGVAPYFEVNGSVMTGEYDHDGRLRFTAYGAHLEGRYSELTVHGEFLRTEQETLVEEEGQVEEETVTRDGYFAVLSYRHGPWQPEVRWSQLFAGRLHENTVFGAGDQLGLGLVYWLDPSLSLKVEYLINYEDETPTDNNRLALQWAFGF